MKALYVYPNFITNYAVAFKIQTDVNVQYCNKLLEMSYQGFWDEVHSLEGFTINP